MPNDGYACDTVCVCVCVFVKEMSCSKMTVCFPSVFKFFSFFGLRTKSGVCYLVCKSGIRAEKKYLKKNPNNVTDCSLFTVQCSLEPFFGFWLRVCFTTVAHESINKHKCSSRIRIFISNDLPIEYLMARFLFLRNERNAKFNKKFILT